MTTTSVGPVVEKETRPARGAWIANALTPVGFVVGFVVAFTIAGFLDVDLFESSSLTFGQNLLVYGPASLIWLASPVVGLVLGVRSARSGNPSGATAATIAAVLSVPLAVLVFTNLTCCWR